MPLTYHTIILWYLLVCGICMYTCSYMWWLGVYLMFSSIRAIHFFSQLVVCVFMWCVSVCLYVSVCSCDVCVPLEARKGHWFLMAGVKQSCELPAWCSCWDLNSGSCDWAAPSALPPFVLRQAPVSLSSPISWLSGQWASGVCLTLLGVTGTSHHPAFLWVLRMQNQVPVHACPRTHLSRPIPWLWWTWLNVSKFHLARGRQRLADLWV